jgi:hypothetical protein
MNRFLEGIMTLTAKLFRPVLNTKLVGICRGRGLKDGGKKNSTSPFSYLNRRYISEYKIVTSEFLYIWQ